MNQAHILVIDDDPAVRDVLEETLASEGHTVSMASDGATGLQLAKEHPVQIALTDYQLPDIDGLDLIDRLSRVDAEIRPIVMTVCGTIETAVRAMKSGAVDFMTKPFDAETVTVVVRKAVEFQRLRQENLLLRKAVRE